MYTMIDQIELNDRGWVRIRADEASANPTTGERCLTIRDGLCKWVFDPTIERSEDERWWAADLVAAALYGRLDKPNGHKISNATNSMIGELKDLLLGMARV